VTARSALARRAEDYARRCTSASLVRAATRFPLTISHHISHSSHDLSSHVARRWGSGRSQS
jgi:hypothetical protein